MGDIEDFDGAVGPRLPKDGISVKIRLNFFSVQFSTANFRNSRQKLPEAGQLDSFVPGTKSVYVRTWGCSHNASDSEYMAGILAEVNFYFIIVSLVNIGWL